MKRCYEEEHFETSFGYKEHHCGNGKRINGIWYCPTNGLFDGYAGRCAMVEPPQEDCGEQITFDDSGESQ